MAVVRWIGVVVLAAVAMTIVKGFVPLDWPAWAVQVPGIAAGLVVCFVAMPGFRQSGWRGVWAIVLGIAGATVASYLLYPVFMR